MASHPLARALRIDGATQAALVVTLEHYASGAGSSIPFWRMAALGYAELEVRHQDLLTASGVVGKVVDSESVPGAGSAPGAAIPSPALQIEANADDSWHALASAPVPIIARRHAGVLTIDLRSVEAEDDAAVIAALRTL
jgi:L-seryl-tRNA(Ser) seleniumtransferase